MTNKRTTKKSKAIAALMSGKNNIQAAHIAGVHERTIYRWLSDPSFQSDLREAETQIIESITRQVASSQEKAMEVLYQLLTAEDASPHIRLNAANSILRMALAFRDRKIERKFFQMEVLVSKFDEYLRNEGRLQS